MASTGGVWNTLVYGFGGLREDGSVIQAMVPESHPPDGMISED